jgi:hypothetical protein
MNWVGGVEAPFAALNLMGQGGIPSIGRSSGGVIKFIRLEHTWVEAYVDFEPSRGVKLNSLDSCEQVCAEPSAVICQTNAPDSASGEKR